MYSNQIICGESVQVLSAFPANSVDLVVTDPPYLVGYRDRSGRTVANDDDPDAVLAVYDELYRVLKPDSYCISFYGWTAIAAFASAWENAGFRPVGHFVWSKPYASKTRYAEYRHESAFLLAKGNPSPPSKPIPDVLPWVYSGNRTHPTEKAVDVIAPLVTCYSRAGDVVLDPFAGSGSTAVAAALKDRRYIGIELDPGYCALACKRLAGVAKTRRIPTAA